MLTSKTLIYIDGEIIGKVHTIISIFMMFSK